MARIAENTVIVDGQEYKPGDVIPDFKSIKCVDTREPRKYQGLSADVSVLNDVIAKYASGGASCFMSDTGEYYEYDREEKTWKLITNITERGFDSEKAYGALKHMLKNVTVSDEKIQSAVTDYLTVNPVLPGATTEQAQQIEQNKTDVASLKEETGSLKEDLGDITTHDIGKNIFFSKWTEQGYGLNLDTGEEKTFSSMQRTGFIAVEPETTYTASTDFGKAPSVYIFYYDKNKTFLSVENTTYGFYPKTFTTPSYTAYVRILQSYQAMPTNYQIELGSTATDYEAPYSNLVVPASKVKDIPKELPMDGTAGQVLKKTSNGCEWADESSSNMSYKGKRFLFLGDSITAMSGDTSWVDKFKILADAGESFKQAVGGAKWCDNESGLIYNGKPYESQNFIGNQVVWCQKIGFDSNKFDYIFVSAGTNDTNFVFPTDEQIETEMYSNDNTIKPLASVDRSTWMGAIRWTVETLREMYPNAKIILVTPLQRRVDMDGSTLKNMYLTIKQKRETIIKMAKRIGTYIIDTSECDITNFDSKDFADNLHPSVKGAEKLAKFIFKKSLPIFCDYN